MGFWGLEVKPGKPQVYHPKYEQGKLHVTQATLGSGLGKKKSVIQCSIGDNNPVYLCSLLPKKTESCPLNLEFDDDDEPVEFSVTGDRSIHLSGFLESYEQEYEQDEEDSDGIDIEETESGESSEYGSEDEMYELEDFPDSNPELYPHSSVPKSGVVLEEIEDEEKLGEDKKTKRPNKKIQASEGESAKKQITSIEDSHDPEDLESEEEDEDEDDEDEDGLPILKEKPSETENKSHEKMDLGNDGQGSNKKRKAKASEQDGEQDSLNKKKKKKNQNDKKKGQAASDEETDEQVQTGNVLKKQETSQQSSSTKAMNKSAEKKKRKKKKNSSEETGVESQTIPSSAEKQISDSISNGKQVNSKSSQVRTYPNGLIVEELSMGKPNGKKAEPGKQVSVRYIGKLQKNGKIFDSNIGKAPFKFRLGIGQVIKGWDVGVNGMRVGDKRKLTIPPSMGYGERGAGGQIPPNAWLMFDVELIDVR